MAPAVTTPQPQQQQAPPMPAGWVPMPSIASQLETDPLKKMHHDFMNIIRAGQPVQAPAQQQQPTAPQPQQAGKTAAKAIKTPLPSASQELHFTCGPSALRAVLMYFGYKHVSEEQLVKETGADPDMGTPPDMLISVARKYGLNAKEKENMSIEELKSFLDKRIPVIICMQAWGDEDEKKHIDYRDVWTEGHYAVAVGYDDRNVYFEDPAIKDGKRGALSYQDLEYRWHDQEAGGKRLEHYGIAMWRENRATGNKGYEPTEPVAPPTGKNTGTKTSQWLYSHTLLRKGINQWAKG